MNDVKGENLANVLAMLPLPAVLVGSDGVVTAANRGATDLLDVAVGHSLGEELAADSDSAVAWRGLVKEGGRAELALRRRGGGAVWVMAAAQSDAAATLVALTDLSAWKAREEELVRARDAAQHVMQSRIRFMRTVGHDLRQPLQALALFTSALDRFVGEGGRAVVNSIRSALTSLEDMFDSLLDISRLDAGILKPEPRILVVNDLLERVAEEFAEQAAASGSELRLVPSSQAVLTDPSLVLRILRNFVSNSIRHGNGARILLGCKRQGDFLRLEVWDNGQGLSEELRRDIADGLGCMSATVEKPPGMGLGLVVVQRVAALLGHRLGLRSTPGRATAFWVEVPLALAEEGDSIVDITP